MERHLKGIANHYRIAILLMIDKTDGATLEDITEVLNANEKTIGEHTRRLEQAGLINKNHNGRYVEHSLSPYGRIVAKFLKSFQQI